MAKKKIPNSSSSIAHSIASMNRPLYDWQALSAALEESRRQMAESIRAVTQAPDLRVEYARIAADLRTYNQSLLKIPRTTGLYESCLQSITRAPVVSFGLKSMEPMPGNQLRDLLLALNGAAALNPPVERPALPALRRESPSLARDASASISEQPNSELCLRVFLTNLPAYFEPPEHPLPKFRLH